VSRVRSLSVRSRWAIVLGLTTMTFAVAQRASAAPPAIPDTATAQSELWIRLQARVEPAAAGHREVGAAGHAERLRAVTQRLR
jgi:hypothetical protein